MKNTLSSEMGFPTDKIQPIDWFSNRFIEKVLDYDPTRPTTFEKTMRLLRIRFEDFTFIDLGSGKGRTLLLASHYPFQKIIGVEPSRHHHTIACDNLRAHRSADQKCFDVTTVCMDAEHFSMPGGGKVVYLLNPFQTSLMAQVVAGIESAFKKDPSDLFVVYVNPRSRSVFDASSMLHLVHDEVGSDPYASFVIYRGTPFC